MRACFCPARKRGKMEENGHLEEAYGFVYDPSRRKSGEFHRHARGLGARAAHGKGRGAGRSRAQQTADILFPGVPRTFSTIIREINNTSMRGKTCDDMTALYGERYLACRKNFDYAPLGIDCESGAHMRARAQEFLDLVAAEETLTRVAAVAHAGLITAMAEVVLGARVGRQMSCGNASVSIFRCENNRWRLRLWNLTPDMD